ncbi:unnamed protein product [Tuber aestivum]|uniref:dolichol kinase n=1 Tax=Tuber aestivum TaxID=59557 RepID=A0A292QA97_9PEZI|nr:unnamed protein product [Tuber aestivum]
MGKKNPPIDFLKVLTSPTRSGSPVANRQQSRSPQPYRRRPPPTPRVPLAPPLDNTAYLPSPALTPEASRGTSRFAQKSYYGGSESGTEADDELARKLPAPPGKRSRTSSEERFSGKEYDTLDGQEGERGRRRRRLIGDGCGLGGEKRKPSGIVFVRRGIEIGLMGILVGIVFWSREGRIWKEVGIRRQEFTAWTAVLFTILASYPLPILLHGNPLVLPRSLDPSPLLYPIFFPILVALSMTKENTMSKNPYVASNLILSLSSLPPTLIPSCDLRWMLSLLPLAIPVHPRQWPNPESSSDALSFLPPLHFVLNSVLTTLLHPSLTSTELKMVTTALINLLIYASSPQAIILKAVLWGGGLGTLILCEDVIRWNVNLARVPSHKLRRAGNAIISIGRWKKFTSLRAKGQASDSEGELLNITLKTSKSGKLRPVSQKSFYTALTHEQARKRKLAYSLWVYGSVVCIVMIALRPYIGKYALAGVDPFLWAPGYLLCGLSWYQSLVDRIAPGSGYCVTGGAASAANLRLLIIGCWLVVLVVGISLVTAVLAHIEVNTRRKVFHGMVVIMFLIPGVQDPAFTYLGLSLTLAVFLLLDTVRAGQLPPFSGKIAVFLQPFVDGRDLKGPVIVSHVFLLLGCAVGWWFTLASIDSQEGDSWDQSGRQVGLAFVSGVVCVGLGDAAASLIGRRFGGTKWGWRGGKSVEGSLAFTLAVMTGLSVARWWVGTETQTWSLVDWAKIATVGLWGSMVEAVVTGVNDNIVVPVGAWILVQGLGLS